MNDEDDESQDALKSKLRGSVYNRCKLEYGYWDLIKTTLKLGFLPCCSRARSRGTQYKQAENQVQHKLDCVNFIKSMQRLEVINNVLFNKKQLILLDHQAENVIRSVNDEEYVIDEADPKEIEKTLEDAINLIVKNSRRKVTIKHILMNHIKNKR